MKGEFREINIDSDKILFTDFCGSIDEIKFIKEHTRDLFNKIKDISNLNYKPKEVFELWISLVGDAIIHLKKRDDRETYNDDMRLGLNKISSYIINYSEFEPIMYGLKDNYRDHITHVFRTYILGHSMIKQTFGYDKIDIKESPIKIDIDEKEAMWCIISLCHDIGYPLEAINIINDPVRKIIKTFGSNVVNDFNYNIFPQFSNISNFALNFMSTNLVKRGDEKNKKYLMHIQPKFYQKFLSALSNYDHGVISGILLMKDLVYFKESDYMFDEYKELTDMDLKQFLIRREIIRSIASHNCEDIYYLKGTSFPFLLKLFDEMQEWGRPRLIDVIKRGGSETKLTIKELNDKRVFYCINFNFQKEALERMSDEEKQAAHDSIEKYFLNKCNEWMNVLRSAVDGSSRDLTVGFKVIDSIEARPKEYSLIHENPTKMTILPKGIEGKINKM